MSEQLKLIEGLPEPPEKEKQKSKYQIWKEKNHYGKAVNANKDGRRCVWCKHLIIKDDRYRYFKCELLGNSNCTATDIRISCVCDLFEEG